MVEQIILKTLLCIECIFLFVFSILIARNYTKNYSYARDVFLTLTCFAFALVPIFVFLGYPIGTLKLILVGFCIFSIYILSNVKTNKVKWFANTFKAIEFVWVIYTLTQDFSKPFSIIETHMCILTFMFLNFLFNILNSNSKIGTCFNFLCGIAVIYSNQLIFNEFAGGHELLLNNSTWIALNLVMLTFNRVACVRLIQLKDKFSFR